MARRRKGLLPPSLDPRRRQPPPAESADQLDASLAVLVDEVEAALATADGERHVLFLELTGRINGQRERAALPFLLGPEAVANLTRRLAEVIAAPEGAPYREAIERAKRGDA